MGESKRKLYLWVSYPDQVAGLYDSLDLLRSNCREQDVRAQDVSVSLQDIETEGAWMSEDEDSFLECHLTEDQSPSEAPSGLVWDWTTYVRKGVGGIGIWEELDSGVFWKYPNMEAPAADMMPADAHRVPYDLADFVYLEARGEWR